MGNKLQVSKLSYWLPIFAVPVIFWNCYWYVGFNANYTKLLEFIIALVLLFIYLKDILNTQKGYFEHDVSLFILSFALSIFTSFVYWEQNPSLTFRAGVTTLSILYFFTLRRRQVDNKNIENICVVFSIIYALLWLYAFYKAPMVVFGNLDEVEDTRGFYRILQLHSIDLVALLYCISLDKISRSSKKWIWIIVACGSFALIFLSLTRILLAGIIAVTVVYLLRKKAIIIILLAAVFSFGGTDYLMKSEIFSGMVEMTKSQIGDKSESNLRMPEYTGAFELFPFHVGTAVFGNGSPHVASSYGQFEERLKAQYYFNRSDAGYVGLYTTYGIFMIIIMLRLLIRVIKCKVPSEYFPYKLFIYFLFIINLTTYTFWSYGIAFMISLYMLDKSKRQDTSMLLDNERNLSQSNNQY